MSGRSLHSKVPGEPDRSAPGRGPPQGARRPTTSTTRRRSTRILVAEDDPDMRRMLARALISEGHEVLEAREGNELLSLLGRWGLSGGGGEPDLIISDIRMPGRSGLDVLRSIREVRWSRPVIMITAFGDEQIHAEARELDAEVFDKPFDIDDLLRAVRALLAPGSEPGEERAP